MAAVDAIAWPSLGGQPLRLYFSMRNTSGQLVKVWTGADSEISKDGGAFVDCTNEAVEISNSGVGYIDLTTGETSGATAVVYKLTVTNASAVELVIPIIKHTASFINAGSETSQLIAQDITNEQNDWEGTRGIFASFIWDENYASHNTAGTFGKLMNTIRKSNLSIEGSVSAGASPTALTFRTNLEQTSGAHDSKLLMFTTGALTAESKPIDSYVSTNGTIVLQEPLTAAPAVGNEFVIVPQHIHSLIESAQVIRSVGVGVRAVQADDGTISLYDGRRYDGTAHPKLSFTVGKDYAAASSIAITFYSVASPDVVIQTVTATRISATLIEVAAFTCLPANVTYAGNPATAEGRYSLTATWGANKETIATGPAFFYDQP